MATAHRRYCHVQPSISSTSKSCATTARSPTSTRIYASIIGLGGANPALGGTTIYDYLATLQADPDVVHGQIFTYVTPKTDAVDWATCRATGRSLVERFDALWRNLGADGDAYLLLDGMGTPVAGGGLNATSDDLARFAAMVLNDGRVGDQVVISKDILDELSAGGSIEAFDNGPEAKDPMAGGDWSYLRHRQDELTA